MKVPEFLIFNLFTKKYLKQMDFFPIPGRRLKSMGTDFSYMISVFFPMILVIMIPYIILSFHTNFGDSIYLNIIPGIFFISVVVFAMINKDFYNGRSVAKRIHGFQIVDNKTNQVASEFQCMVRNLTLIIWPVEVLAALINPGRRLGDLIAGTRLIDSEKLAPETIIEEINHVRTGKSHSPLVLVSILFTLLFVFLSSLPMLFMNLR